MSFDALASSYRAFEFLVAGGKLHRCRTAFLQEAAQAKAALLLGEGPGRYLAELLRVNPGVEVTCLDSSRCMLAEAKRRLETFGLADRTVRYACTDWEDWRGEGGPFDLVATHFFLDCFQAAELGELIAKVASLTAPGATWVLSDFRVPTGGWQRLRARLVLKIAYLFFRWATGLSASHLTPAGPFLVAADFCLVQRRLYNHGLLHADLWRASAGV
jgi:ubiquinone/menaquinone biosynthesis C-methylase UbiE